MDFNLKKFANDASGFFSRAKQYTEETFLKAEKTELDANFEVLLQRADKTEEHTKKLLSCIEGYLQPNPTARVEDVFYEKLDLKKDNSRQNALEHLGQAMLDASNEFGPTTAYGAALMKVAQTQQKLGGYEHEFLGTTAANTLIPIRRFLEGDMKTIQKERKVLNGRRLDLDSCKSRLKKAKTLEAQASAEADVRVAQAEFDKQVEITKLLLEGIQTAHNNHLKYLRDFVDAQMTFYAQAHQAMSDLQRELSGASSHSSTELIGVCNVGGGSPLSTDSATRQARAIMDYSPIGSSEIELRMNEVVVMYTLPGLEPDYVMVEKKGRRGRVPTQYLETLD